MKRFLLNVGLHKTGTTAIQQSLQGLVTPEARYLDFDNPNHSALYATAFMDKPETYRAHKGNGRSAEEVAEIRARYRRRMNNQLRRLPADMIVLSSAEDASLLSGRELRRLKAYLEVRVDEVRILAYVRPPSSLLASILQQRIAGGVKTTDANLVLGYRDRLEKLDQVFGAENVEMALYDRDKLRDGDVVADLLARAGLGHLEVASVRANESRPFEATAALSAYRQHCRQPDPYPGNILDNGRLNKALSELGSSRLSVHPDFVARVIGAQPDDIAWVSERMGVDFATYGLESSSNLSEDGVRSVADLADRAGALLPKVVGLLAEAAQTGADFPAEATARAVDLLREVLRADREHKHRRNAERRAAAEQARTPDAAAG